MKKVKLWSELKSAYTSDEERGPTSNSKIANVAVDDIKVVKGHFRDLDKEVVADLADSIRTVGLMHPPTVCIRRRTDDSDDRTYRLVAGHHRLAAVKKLGWDRLDVIVVKRVTRKNRMRRITENLHRSNLTKLEQARQINEWLELRFAGDGHVAQPGDKGISAAAKHFGKSRRTIQRLTELGAIVPEAARALRDAKLDSNGRALARVACVKPRKQVRRVAELVRKRRCKWGMASEHISEQTGYEKLLSAWDGARGFRAAWLGAVGDDRSRFIERVLMKAE